MSKRKRKRAGNAPLPSTGAGLLRFFEEETAGFKVKPEIVVILGATLIIVCILAQLFL